MVKIDWKGRLIIIVDRFDCQLSDVVNLYVIQQKLSSMRREELSRNQRASAVRDVATEVVRRQVLLPACTHVRGHPLRIALADFPGKARLSRARPVYQWDRPVGSR